MAGINPGRNAGRLSIRVIPNTNEFRRDLKRRLDMIERTSSMTVNVTKAKLNGAKIREDIRRQLGALKDLDTVVKFKAQADVKAVKDVVASVGLTMDRLTIDRLRKDVDKAMRGIEVTLTPTMEDQGVRRQLDALRAEFHAVSGRLANDIMSAEDAEKLRIRLHGVKEQIDQIARNREARIDANPFTAWASARLAWLTRPRTVEVFVKVSKASVAAALTTLSALSGARLSWQWIDDLSTSLKNLDKNLPSIIGATTGITSLIGALFAATSGLVGIGQGLFSILPALLVVPGLFLNAVGSVTALVVALRNAKTELSPLSDDMSELSGIINGAFWSRARQPILDLVTGLMPQLRNSFREVSSGIGDFTASLANAFGEELGGGNLEKIFGGIAEGWRILSTGAPAFAGAMTSLSQVASKYTPRLATWFVRQANTFDNWLEAVSSDGRLDGWMEGAITSMYDLWDATTGIAGVFKGLWSAADAAGSTGLAGFADMMQDWDRVVNGADFQRGLTAVFRGARVAMSAFGDAVSAIGRMILGLDTSIEKFIGSAGIFLGGLIEGAANALNQPSVDKGLLDLSDGLIRALDGILPHLPKIADTFGGFLGLLGDLVGTLLPTAAGVLAELMPTIDSVISSIRDSGVLETLGGAVTEIAETLGPSLAGFADAVGPVLIDAFIGLADALVDIAPVLSALIDTIGEWIAALGDWSESNGEFFDAVREFMGWDKGSSKGLNDLGKLGQFKPEDDGNPFTVSVKFDFERYWNDSRLTTGEKARGIAQVFMDEYDRVLKAEGKDSADALVESFRNIEGLPTDVVAKINESLRSSLKVPDGTLTSEATRIADRIKKAFETGDKSKAWMTDYLSVDLGTRQEILNQLGDLADDARDALDLKRGGRGGGGGGGFSRQLAQGITEGLPELDRSMYSMKDSVMRGMAGSETWLTPHGTSIMGGMKTGMDGYKPIITTDMANMGVLLSGAMASAGSWLFPTGAATMTGMQQGAEAARGGVINAFTAVQPIAGGAMGGAGGWFYGIGAAMMSGIVRGIVDNSGAVARAAGAAVSRAVNAAQAAGEIHSPSRLTARKIGGPLAQGIAVGINKEAAGIQRSMVDAIDFSGVNGTAPDVAGGGATRGSGATLNIYHPTVRDLKSEAWEAAQLLGAIQ